MVLYILMHIMLYELHHVRNKDCGVWKCFEKHLVSRANNDNTKKVVIARWSSKCNLVCKTIFYKFCYTL